MQFTNLQKEDLYAQDQNKNIDTCSCSYGRVKQHKHKWALLLSVNDNTLLPVTAPVQDVPSEVTPRLQWPKKPNIKAIFILVGVLL